ncbi:MAG: pyrimidine-nucleoside phosphorylase [Erysipelotrichaceae bacterium]|nr:pyrimidine-nucleoside phosphorylase [Erysipelotrichaceae bacterium]
MLFTDIIEKKKIKEELSEEEIQFFIDGFCKGEIPDYQVSALLMAIRLNGMSEKETYYLTKAMTYSGNVVDLSGIEGIKVDKHSTGGVGDKTTIALMPMVASLGAKVAKMSGRALGFCGGTVDKLESIPGYRLDLNEEEVREQVNRIGIALIGQSTELAPANKKIYALRDVTATVDSIPLIASSIMSKKLACGNDVIVLDVKYGNGAFMKDIQSAEELAREMIKIGENAHKRVSACLSSMKQPLGNAVGNALEVIEAIETLKGRGPKDFTELCLISGSVILEKAGLYTREEAYAKLEENIHNGKALEKLREVITAQGGDPRVVDDYSLLPQAKYVTELKAEESGYVKDLPAQTIGELSMQLGAGRATKEESIDYAVGIVLNKKIGDRVEKGETLAYIHHDTELKEEWWKRMQNVYVLSVTPVKHEAVVEKVI